MTDAVIRDANGYERVVMGVVLAPDVPNVYGDIYTSDAIKEFVYEFAKRGFGIDKEHDEQNVDKREAVVVESFIAREGDPDFPTGAWVVGMLILDEALWQSVLDHEVNGFSIHADAFMTPIVLRNLRNRVVSGVTSPDPIDGHTHTYMVVLNALNRPISGGTDTTNGHSHTIVSHSVTNTSKGHRHRYQVITPDQSEEDDDQDE